jgi:peptidyl-prolyl cis-trans isomerase B (cyclophilin B)
MKKSLFLFFFIALITSCAQNQSGDDYIVTIKTSFGDMKAVLYDETPLHKENFIKLVEKKYFDSLLFHRVIQGFMIQGGDPDSKKAQAGQHLGSGGPGYTVPAEINAKFFHERGALSAARLGDAQNPKKESSGSQFYVVQGTVLRQEDLDGLKINQQALMTGLGQMFQSKQHPALFDSLNQLYTSGDMQAYQTKLFQLAPRVEKITGLKVSREVSPGAAQVYTTVGGAPHLDGDYTVFGKVIKGLEVIDKIAAVQKDQGDRPLEDIRMTVTLEKMSRKKIEQEFGYKYPQK